jgi:hypothetical protein
MRECQVEGYPSAFTCVAGGDDIEVSDNVMTEVGAIGPFQSPLGGAGITNLRILRNRMRGERSQILAGNNVADPVSVGVTVEDNHVILTRADNANVPIASALSMVNVRDFSVRRNRVIWGDDVPLTATGGPNNGAIYVSAATDGKVTHNFVKNAPLYGIEFATNSSNVQVEDNEVLNPALRKMAVPPPTGNHMGIRMVVGTTSTGVAVRRNLVRDRRATKLMDIGIQVSPAGLVDVEYNVIEGVVDPTVTPAYPVNGSPRIRRGNRLTEGPTSGVGTLVAGTVVVNTPEIQAGISNIIVQRTTAPPGAWSGYLVPTQGVQGVSFTVNSYTGAGAAINTTDNGQFRWWIDH